MEDFTNLGLNKPIVDALNHMHFKKPTPIQQETIPTALNGFDILGSSQTGTGKTAAFAIPLAAHLLNNPKANALVLTPTRELAQQVLETLKKILITSPQLKMALLIGGESMDKQFKSLKAQPRLVVGTPGRVNDHLTRRSLNLSKTTFLVLDETDRMLDEGFSVQLDKIVSYLPTERQTLMFSATMSPTIIKLSETYLKKDAVRISVGSTTSPTERITQEVIKTSESGKYDILLEQLNQSQGSFIIFVKTKMGTERLADKLNDHGIEAGAIHGDLSQRHRERVMNSFRKQRKRVLVATDIAARGIDIPHIECVVNYDLPQCPEDYIHRIGRTGRAEATGRAVNLITSQDSIKWRNICKLMNPDEKFEDDFKQSDPNRKRKFKGFKGGRRDDFKKAEFGGDFKQGMKKRKFSGQKPMQKPVQKNRRPSAFVA